MLLWMLLFGILPSLVGWAAAAEPEAVLRQTGKGFPATWGVREGAPVAADYEMDPEITQDLHYRDLLPAALKSLPAVRLSLPNEELFGAERGIYAHPMETGDSWERTATVSMTATNGASVFETRCGVQIQGGWNRRPEESPKHAFRLVFKKKHGPGKLKADIFGPGSAREFDTLVLRAGCNNTWLHWKGIERLRGDFLRDQWMRDTQRAMGQAAARGLFVHLYLNGLYWGLYNLTERPDDSFASEYMGGARKDYDARNADKLVSGDSDAWDELMRRLNAGVRTEADYLAVAQLLNVENFIDYMLLNLYGANADWDRSSNWYAARPRKKDGRFVFFVWDAERTLEEVEDNTIALDDDQSPTRIFQALRKSGSFRRQFAERSRTHFAGALSPEQAAGRYRALAKQIELGVICESARWGDYRRDVHPYREGPYQLYTPKDWQNEVSRLLHAYFPARTAVLRRQLKNEGLLDGGTE